MLIRHGESRAQVARVFSGHDTCTGLTGGCARWATSGRSTRSTRAFSPGRSRAAEIIGPALGGAPPRAECDWCEIHPGRAEGLSFGELYEKFPDDGEPGDPFRRRGPGGETWAEFYAARRAWSPPHAGLVRCTTDSAHLRALGISVRTMRYARGRDTSITEWRWTADGDSSATTTRLTSRPGRRRPRRRASGPAATPRATSPRPRRGGR